MALHTLLRTSKKVTIGFFVISITIALVVSNTANAAIIDELKQDIADRNTKIEGLEREIEAFQTELVEIGEEKQTLQTAVRILDISRNKLSTDIQITENRIYSTGLQINQLGIEIEEKEERIVQNTATVAKAIRTIHEIESQSLIEALLTHDNLADFWDEVETLQQFQIVMRKELTRLVAFKNDLEKKIFQSENKKQDLTGFKSELGDQKKVLDISRQTKDTLLKTTKNKESNYKKLLDEKIKLREQFEQELFDFESQLKIAIDPESIPPAQSGILVWPLKDIKITQYFGNTKFASENPQVYSGKGHNGVDFRAAPGTKVKAALGGVVTAWGNTDAVRGCYSYGKWVLIKHNNGLSTLYAHLSHISVQKNEEVKTGSIIGYSGNTGYSTGPHLHFTVYATQGMRIVKLGDIKKITNCAEISIPVADPKAYLNPLSYL